MSYRGKQALFYPGVVGLVAMIVLLIMLVCVIPRFAELFENAHCDLPLLTQVILALSAFIQHYFLWIVFLLSSVIGLFAYLYRLGAVKIAIESRLLKLPILQELIQKSNIAYLARILSTLLAAGIPVTDSLAMVAASSKSHVYRAAIHMLKQRVLMGNPLYAAIVESPLFPPMVANMVQVGEESGTLERMLEKLALFYENDVDYLFESVKQSLEPLIMAVLGVLIGGMVAAMYLPIFKLGTTM